MAAVEEEEMERGKGEGEVRSNFYIGREKESLHGELAVRGTDEWEWVKARKARAAVTTTVTNNAS